MFLSRFISPSAALDLSFDYLGRRDTTFKMTFVYPTSEKGVLEAYKEAKFFNQPLPVTEDRKLWNFAPKSLSEYQLKLVLLVYEMPEATWSQRLERYLVVQPGSSLR